MSDQDARAVRDEELGTVTGGGKNGQVDPEGGVKRIQMKCDSAKCQGTTQNFNQYLGGILICCNCGKQYSEVIN